MHRQSALVWLGRIGVGAAAMFLLDPSEGRRRRTRLRDQTLGLARRSRHSAVGVASDLRNRTRGALARLRSSRNSRPVDDPVIEARVRTAIGRVSTHPGALAIASIDGVVELNGPVLAREHDAVLRTAESAPGVLAVVDHTTLHEDGAGIPALQGEGSLPAQRRRWSPATLAAVGGTAAVAGFALTRLSTNAHSQRGRSGARW